MEKRKREHRHFAETGIARLNHVGLPRSYWSYAFETANFVTNRLPTHVLNDSTPQRLNFILSLDYTVLEIFACSCYPCLRPYNS